MTVRADLLRAALGLWRGPAVSDVGLETIRQRIGGELDELRLSATACCVVVTSRELLSGLVVSHGARRLTLDVLTDVEAVELLGTILGTERVRAEPSATNELARRCAFLPLALRIAAANLASQPERSITNYVEALETW